MNKKATHTISKIYNKNKNYSKCYCPKSMGKNCSKKIINSHTVSKSSNLKQIAKNSHVYSLEADNNQLFNSEFIIKAKLIGINKASTFKIFCSEHDSKLFEDFENNPLEINNKHSLLLFFRTLVMELYKKEIVYKNYQDIILKLKETLTLDSQKSLIEYRKAIGVAIRDLTLIKEKLDEKLINNDFSRMKYYALILDNLPNIVSSAVWTPTYSFENKALFDLSDISKMAPVISINTLSYEGKGIIYIIWDEEFDDENYCKEFIRSLNTLNNNEKILAILNWIFKCNENIFISPDWWESLTSEKQSLLINKFGSLKDGNYRIDDYQNLHNFVEWNIENIITNI